MSERLELILSREGGRVRLLSPLPGVFTCPLADGQAVTPGEPVGVALSLGRVVTLLAPAGASGRVSYSRGSLVREPVGFATVLYELTPLEEAAEQGSPETEDDPQALVLRATYSGRFWARPTPGAPAYAEPGTVLEAGQPVGLVEVMKTFTQIPYESGSGLPEKAVSVRICQVDGAEIRAGDPLVEVRKK